MPELQVALEKYQQAITAQGFDLFGTIRRGRERADVIAQLVEAGVDPVDDVVDWFTFSDGRPSIRAGEQHLFGIFDDLTIVSLDEALAERARRLDPSYQMSQGFDDQQFRELSEADLLVPFLPSWMPISYGKQTCVIETDRRAPRFRQLIALWNDELNPRIKAASAAGWVEQLTLAVPTGSVGFATAPTAGKVASAIFALGSVELTKPRASRLRLLLDNTFLLDCVGIRVVHAHRGSLPDNAGLEIRQAEFVEQFLREIGFDGHDYERVASEPEFDHLHAIAIFGLVET